MNYDVTYSLRMALESDVPELNDVQMIYEGVDITTIPKPFATVEYLQGLPELMAAGRTSYLDTYNFQVGVFARDINERHRLEAKIRKVIRKSEGHPLYEFDEQTGTFVDTGKLVPFDENGFTPVGNDDNSANTYDFHGYFDVGFEIY
jgi:hypothetical protein